MAFLIYSILIGLLWQQIIAKPSLGGDDSGNILGGLGLNGLLGSGGTLSGIIGSTGNLGGILGSSGGDSEVSKDSSQPPVCAPSAPTCLLPSPPLCPTQAPVSPSISFSPVSQPVPVRIPAACPQSVTIPNIIVALLPPTEKKPVSSPPVSRPLPVCQPQPIVVPVPQPCLVPVYEDVCCC